MKSKRTIVRSIVIGLAFVGLLAVWASPAGAAPLTWDADGLTAGQTDGGGVWDGTGTNLWWDGANNTDWLSGSDANFGNGSAGGDVTLAGPTAVGLLKFNPFTGTYTLGTSGQMITLNTGGNSITMNTGAGNVTVVSPITLGAAQAWQNNSSSLLTIGTDTVTNGGFLLTVNGSGSTTISGAIGGLGGLTKGNFGGGTLTLSGSNNYTGITTVGVGLLKLENANAIPGGVGATGGTNSLAFNGGIIGLTSNFSRSIGAAANQVMWNANTAGGFAAFGADCIVDFGGAGDWVKWSSSGSTDNTRLKGTLYLSHSTATNTVTIANSIDFLSGTRTVSVADGAAAVDAVLSGSLHNGKLTKTGPGTLVLTGTYTASGSMNTRVEGGTLSIGGAGQLAYATNTGTIFIEAGATLNHNSSANQTLSGIISGDGVITKTGTGTLTLSNNANTYTGATTIDKGKLLVNGSLAAAAGKVTVNANGTLGGTGTIARDVDVFGTLAPGASIESLDTGALSIAATGTLDNELGRNSGTPVSDIVNVTGAVTLAAGANLKLTLFAGLGQPVFGDIFYLVANDSADAVTGVFTKLDGTTTMLVEGSVFTWNSQSWQITYKANYQAGGGSSFAGGNDIAIKVPEPATMGLLAIGGLALLRRRLVTA